jgi:hypothetical protein
VPTSGVYLLEVWGAQGGGSGGYGGYAKGEIELNKGEILYIFVGERGGQPTGGWNGGGNGGRLFGYGYGGGGATDIRRHGASLYDRIIVAGGGGGQGTNGTQGAAGGGGGGWYGGGAGRNGQYGDAGGGGTQTSGGTHYGASDSPPVFGVGGSGVISSFFSNTGTSGIVTVGGYGGGLEGGTGVSSGYGGGGGGGGSAYISPEFSGAETTAGINPGHGKAAISLVEHLPDDYNIGTKYYVSIQNGNDNNDGLTAETAWASINKAAVQVTANIDGKDTYIYIAPGEYRTTIKLSNPGISETNRIIFYGDPDCTNFPNDKPGIVRLTATNINGIPNSEFPCVDFGECPYIEFWNIYMDGQTNSVYTVVGNDEVPGQVLNNVRITSVLGANNVICYNCQITSSNICYNSCTVIQSIAIGGQNGFFDCEVYNSMSIGAENGYNNSAAYNSIAYCCTANGFLNCDNYYCYSLCCKDPASGGTSVNLRHSLSVNTESQDEIFLMNTEILPVLAEPLIDRGSIFHNLPPNLSALLNKDYCGAQRFNSDDGATDIGPWAFTKYSYDWENYLNTAPALRIDGAGDIIFKVPVKKGERVSKGVSVRSFVPDSGLENTFYTKENLQEGNLQNLEYTASGLKLLDTEYAGFRDLEYGLPELESIVFSKISWQEKANQDGLYFDGIDDRVVIPHHSSIKPSQITVAVWAKKDDWTKSNSANSGSGNIVSCQQSGGYAITASQSGRANFIPYINGGYRTISSPDPLSPGSHFICGTYDGQHLRLYIDGELVSETAYSGSISYSYNNALMFGANPNATTGVDAGYFFEGLIQSVSLWNRALSQEEIVRYYHDEPEGNEEGLISYYKMDSYSGNVVNDLVGNNHGTIVGAIWKNIPPVKIETNFSRDGVNWDGWVECQNGEPIPGVPTEGLIKNGKLAIRQTFIPIQSVSPVLESVVITINGFSRSYGRPQLILRYHGEEAVATSKDSHEDWNRLSVGIVPQSTGVADLILRSTEPRKEFYCLFSNLR